MPEEQQLYYLETFDSKFNPLHQIGLVTHSEGLKLHRQAKKKNLLSCLTEKELVELIRDKKRKTQEDIAKTSQAVNDYYTK